MLKKLIKNWFCVNIIGKPAVSLYLQHFSLVFTKTQTITLGWRIYSTIPRYNYGCLRMVTLQFCHQHTQNVQIDSLLRTLSIGILCSRSIWWFVSLTCTCSIARPATILHCRYAALLLIHVTASSGTLINQHSNKEKEESL